MSDQKNIQTIGRHVKQPPSNLEEMRRITYNYMMHMLMRDRGHPAEDDSDKPKKYWDDLKKLIAERILFRFKTHNVPTPEWSIVEEVNGVVDGYMSRLPVSTKLPTLSSLADEQLTELGDVALKSLGMSRADDVLSSKVAPVAVTGLGELGISVGAEFNFSRVNNPVKEPQKGVLLGVGVLVTRPGGEVLVGKRKGSHAAGTWSFPGGSVEFGERIEEAVRRELLEETGLVADKVEVLPCFTEDLFMDVGKHFLTTYCRVTLKDPAQVPVNTEPHKCEGWEWHSWGEIPEPRFPGMDQFIKNYVRHRSDVQ